MDRNAGMLAENSFLQEPSTGGASRNNPFYHFIRAKFAGIDGETFLLEILQKHIVFFMFFCYDMGAPKSVCIVNNRRSDHEGGTCMSMLLTAAAVFVLSTALLACPRCDPRDSTMSDFDRQEYRRIYPVGF